MILLLLALFLNNISAQTTTIGQTQIDIRQLQDLTSDDVDLGNVDNTSDLDKPVSTAQQAALDLKYDASNPLNFIDSSGAPVQPADIANFETSALLDGRDAGNRNRANHTGTQLSSTISDFNSAVQSLESLTTLSLGANTLSYVAEDGLTTNIDLSGFLDDTNLARIVSSSLTSSTGILTFTRDDASSFTVDLSFFNDQAAISAAISAHIADPDPHTQYQTSAESQAQVDAHANLTNNPHSVTATQVGLGNVDNTSDLNKPVSTAQQAALDLKYDASNPDGFINNTQGQSLVDAHANLTNNPHSVTAAQVGAETTAQLDARDSANRARANHTGVQPFTSISELPTPSAANAGAIFFPRVNSAGTAYEAWQYFKQSDERTTGLINQQANTFETYFSVTYDLPEAGRYLFTSSYQYSINITTSNFLAHYVIDGGAPVLPLHIETQDSGGPGIVFPVIAGGVEGPGTASTGTDQFLKAAVTTVIDFATAGSHTILLEFSCQVAFNECAIYRSNFTLERLP